MFVYFTQINKIMVPVDYDELCIYNTQSNNFFKKAIQTDILQNTADMQKEKRKNPQK